MFGDLSPDPVKSYAPTTEYCLQPLVTPDRLPARLVEAVGPGVGVEAGHGVLGVAEVVPAHQTGEAGLESVHGQGRHVIERTDSDKDWAGEEQVRAGGHSVEAGEGITLAHPLSLHFLLTGDHCQAGDDLSQRPLDSVHLDLDQEEPGVVSVGVSGDEDLVR